MKRPAFQFYPADWRKDPALSTCSLAARGLWVEMLCIAHESETYGVLSIAGNPMTVQQIARGVGESPATVAKLISELEASKVFSRDEKGRIYSRRMVRDERLRNIRAEAGRLGGNPDLLGKKVKQNDKQKLTPSSSSSTSVYSVANATGAAAPPAPPNSEPPSPQERIFALGLPLLLAAGLLEKNARSMLGLMRKTHGDAAVADAVDRLASAQPSEPVAWLQAALKAKPREALKPGKVDIYAGLQQ
jgi:hypothetical protein